MTPRNLSIAAWTGGAITGAAIARKHRVAGGALGAFLIGVGSDALIDRHRCGLPIAGGVLTGVGLIALAAYGVRHDWWGK